MERDVVFNGGVAFGVDKALIPLGFGGNCDDIKEAQITVIVVMAHVVLLEISNLVLPCLQSTNPPMSLTREKCFIFSLHRANVETVLFL